MPPRDKPNQKLEGGQGSQEMQFGDTDQEREEWSMGVGDKQRLAPHMGWTSCCGFYETGEISWHRNGERTSSTEEDMHT